MADFRDIVQSFGIAAGGLWAAWTFHKLQRVRSAEIERRKGLLEMRRNRLQEQEQKTKLLAQQPVLQMRLGIDQDSDGENGLALRVTVSLSNRGDRNLEMKFNDSFITVGRVIRAKNGVRIEEVLRLAPWVFHPEKKTTADWGDRIFRVGQSRQMSYIAPLPGTGAYVVQCCAEYYAIPFDGETSRKWEATAIYAIEQGSCIVHGRTHVPQGTT